MSKGKKLFDCVEMKRTIQEEIERETEGAAREGRMKYLRELAQKSQFIKHEKYVKRPE